MPENGYTEMVDGILDHPDITVRLKTGFDRADTGDYDHTFYSGALDGYFDYAKGRLGYRTLDFERFTYDGDYQGWRGDELRGNLRPLHPHHRTQAFLAMGKA